MRVKFLGSDSYNGNSPTMWETDRDTLILRGYVVTDPEALAGLGQAPTGEIDIEIPRELIRFADAPNTEDPRYKADREGDEADEGDEERG